MSEARFPYCCEHPAPPAGASAIKALGVSISYPGAQGPAVEDVEWRVPIGALVALIGPNGSGKSTLVKAAAGLLPINHGMIEVFGHPPGSCRHRVAYLAQRAEVDWRFPIDVRKLVMAGRYVHLGWLRWPDRRDHTIVEQALERLGLADLAERQIGQLSGGQQQRALLARALAQEADLLLLDEPLNAVDARTRAIIADVLLELKQQGKTVVVSTHQLNDAAWDDVLSLREGRVVPYAALPVEHAHA